ncbi:MAG: hypothetical protein U0174_15540 [Polyangiaceae bacterium]
MNAAFEGLVFRLFALDGFDAVAEANRSELARIEAFHDLTEVFRIRMHLRLPVLRNFVAGNATTFVDYIEAVQ